jgi:hypothetical protein
MTLAVPFRSAANPAAVAGLAPLAEGARLMNLAGAC